MCMYFQGIVSYCLYGYGVVLSRRYVRYIIELTLIYEYEYLKFHDSRAAKCASLARADFAMHSSSSIRPRVSCRMSLL